MSGTGLFKCYSNDRNEKKVNNNTLKGKRDYKMWEKSEIDLFIKGLEKYGRNFENIHKLIGTKTLPQVYDCFLYFIIDQLNEYFKIEKIINLTLKYDKIGQTFLLSKSQKIQAIIKHLTKGSKSKEFAKEFKLVKYFLELKYCKNDDRFKENFINHFVEYVKTLNFKEISMTHFKIPNNIGIIKYISKKINHPMKYLIRYRKSKM